MNSRLLKITRGVRQGCTLSPLLFNLIIEMLAIAVRSSSGVEGIRTFSTVHKVSLYTDDAGFFLSNPNPCAVCIIVWSSFHGLLDTWLTIKNLPYEVLGFRTKLDRSLL